MVSYSTWVYKYRKYLLKLRDIFATTFLKRFPEQEEFVYSDKFFTDFCSFVYNNSSKKINEYLE